jgi:uncharacterized protein
LEKTEALQPTRKDNRVDLLDVYRGFAVLGIFVVNIVVMNSTYLNQDVFAQQWTSDIDKLAERILQLFFYTKFFPIFSLLFGLGISMQALSLKAKGELRFSFFARRMFILLLIGAAHITFLWSGDVLNIYAVLGLLVTLFLSRSNKLILGLSAFFLLFPFYDQLLAALFSLIHFQPEAFLQAYDGELVHRIISQGSYYEGIMLRLNEYMANIPMLLGFLAPVALSMFLLGLYLGKNQLYKSLNSFIHSIKIPMLTIAVLTNLYRLIFLFVLPQYEIYTNEILRPVFFKAMVLSDVAMGMFYLWAIGWLWYNSRLQLLLKPLRHVGRMALTNYIMQSVIGLFLFSSLGFGLYETLSPFETLLIAFAVYSVQLIYSKLWLTYYKFGPLEWMWRCFTYKKVLPIRKAKEKTLVTAS